MSSFGNVLCAGLGMYCVRSIQGGRGCIGCRAPGCIVCNFGVVSCVDLRMYCA